MEGKKHKSSSSYSMICLKAYMYQDVIKFTFFILN